MKPEYYLKKLREAFLRNDYDAQTEYARRLLIYEESGTVTNEMVIELLSDYINGDPNDYITQYHNILIKVRYGNMSDKEINATAEHLISENPDKIIKEITISVVDDENAIVTFSYDSVDFQRIRRITGYLVGTLDRFNNAKRAEERDRVKHSLI